MKNLNGELPIRSKVKMCEDIALIIGYLHQGNREKAEELMEELKTRAVFLDDEIQGDVLNFSEQVAFQQSYDPFHRVTPNVQEAADHLIEDLGFYSFFRKH